VEKWAGRHPRSRLGRAVRTLHAQMVYEDTGEVDDVPRELDG